MWPSTLHRSSRPPLFYGWLIVAVTFFLAFATVGARSSFGNFVVPMSEEFDWSRSKISLAASIGYLVNGFTQPFLGQLYDKYGGRKVILTSVAIFGLSIFLLFTTFHIVYLIFMFGFVNSIAASGGSVSNTSALVARWFRRKRGTALGLSIAGAALGAMVIVPFSMFLLEMTSWQVTWAALGAMIMFVAMPLGIILMRDDPKDMGLQPDGDPEPAQDNGQTPAAPAARGPLEVDSWRSALRTFPLWQLSGSYFVCGFTTGMITTHFVPYSIDRGFSPSVAATAFGVLAAFDAIGVIIISALSDKVGRKNVLGAVYACRGVGFALLIIAPGYWGLWAFAALAGFAFWASAPLTTSLTAEVYGLRALGTLTGIALLVHQVGGAVAIQFGGILYDTTGSYDIAYAVTAILLIPASISAFTIRERKYSVKYLARPASSGIYAD